MVAQRIKKLNPYVPGEQPTDKEYIKLNANENPYPPHESVREAVKATLDAHPEKMGLYPDPDVGDLRQAIADMLNATGGVLANANINGETCSPDEKNKLPFTVTPDMIFCGNGSDEVLSLVFYMCFDSSIPLVMPEHSYSFYPVYCGFYGIPMNRIPLKEDWTLAYEEMTDASFSNRGCMIFPNPNAPTGLALSRAEIENMLEKSDPDRIVVVDEAYADFAEESCIPLIHKFPNKLIVVRTFSKSLSFAGMRLGYTVASPFLTDIIRTVKNSFNHFPVDFIAKTAGIASCKAAWYSAENAKKIVAERDSFIQWLKDRNWFVLDSKTNFVFAKKKGLSGKHIYEQVKKGGILIRHFNTKGIEDFVRMTIGTHEQMEALKNVLSTL